MPGHRRIGAAGLLALTTLGSVAIPAAEVAGETEAAWLSFNAFGSFGVVHSSEDQADFPRSSLVPSGAGFTDRWSSTVDSIVAGQVSATLTSRFTAVLQVVSEYNYDNSFRPHVEWASIKYQVTPELSLRLGRTALPVFMLTESRKIGYALISVRPPTEFYSLVPVTSNDGLDALWQARIGPGTNTLQLTLGTSKVKFAGGIVASGEAVSRELITIADTYEHGFLTVRGNYGRSRLTVAALDPLFDAFRQFGAQGAAIADQYEVKDSPTTFMGLGVGYDPGKWFAMAEWGHLRQNTALGDRTGWYVSGGARFAKLWRWGMVTPFATFAKVKPSSDTFAPGLDLATLPPSLAAPAALLNAGLNQILSVSPDQATQTLGLRWDFMRDVALSLQYDRVDLGAQSGGTLVNFQPGFERGGSLDLFSIAISFVL